MLSVGTRSAGGRGALGRRRWALRIAAVPFGILGALLAAEIGLRVAGVSFPVFDAYDPVRGVALLPGKRGWYTKEGRAYLEINSLGYRDLEHPRAKPAGGVRIAFLGDSFTEARQVALDDTYWKQVERRLNADARGSGTRVEALCFAVGGYSTTQALLTLRLHVLDFAPDVVVLAVFAGNDLAENSRRLSYAAGDMFRPFHVVRDGALALDDSFRDLSLDTVQNGFLLGATHYSRVLEVANQWRRDRQVRARQEQYRARPELLFGTNSEVYAPPRDEAWSEAWSITEALLLQMDDEVRRAGARFVVAVLTTEAQVEPDRARLAQIQARLGVDDLFYAERRLRDFGLAHDITVITVAEQMQAEAQARNVYFHGFDNIALGHGHWNVDGHAAAARIIADALVASGAVLRPPAAR